MSDVVSLEDNSFSLDDHIPQSLTKEESQNIRISVKEKCTKIEKMRMEIAEDLYIIKTQELYYDWQYESFEDYVEKELPIKKRQAQYYVSVFGTLVYKYNIPKDFLFKIGISKCKILASNIGNCEDQDKILTDVETNSVDFLRGKYKKDSDDEPLLESKTQLLNNSDVIDVEIEREPVFDSKESFLDKEEVRPKKETVPVMDEDSDEDMTDPDWDNVKSNIEKDMLGENKEKDMTLKLSFVSEEQFDLVERAILLNKDILDTESQEVSLAGICKFFIEKYGE